MEEQITRESLSLMLRMKHDQLQRRGKPRLGQVLPDGQIDLLIDVMPAPSKLWWQCLHESAEGTVMEGRVISGGNAVLAIQSTEEELEADVRRVDEMLQAANRRYDQKFREAEKTLAAMNQKQEEEEDPDDRKRRLEERLRNF